MTAMNVLEYDKKDTKKDFLTIGLFLQAILKIGRLVYR